MRQVHRLGATRHRDRRVTYLEGLGALEGPSSNLGAPTEFDGTTGLSAGSGSPSKLVTPAVREHDLVKTKAAQCLDVLVDRNVEALIAAQPELSGADDLGDVAACVKERPVLASERSAGLEVIGATPRVDQRAASDVDGHLGRLEGCFDRVWCRHWPSILLVALPEVKRLARPPY